MQTDAWLTDPAYPDRCPLCSQPLAGRSHTCPACGFTAHERAGIPARPLASKQPNPITPIPARASAHRAQSRPGAVPRRGRTDAGVSSSSAITPSSATQSAQQGGGWPHESASYEAASSLSSLSLIISETPTAPPRTPQPDETMDYIDEIDTIPQPSGRTPAAQQLSDRIQMVPSTLLETPLPASSLPLRFDDLNAPDFPSFLSKANPPVPVSHVDEIDTVPEASQNPVKALEPLRSASREVVVDAASWTAGPGSASSLAARLIPARPSHRRRKRRFNPLDRTRWWLLRPGHIEFLLWTAGSILLFGITFLLLLATVLSAMIPGLQGSGNFPTSTVKASVASPVTTLAASNNLRLALSGKASLLPGAEMRLQGTGFHPQSKVIFLLDGRLPLLDQHGQAASLQTDAAGRFGVNLWLGQGPGWSAGSHRIFAREAASGYQVLIAITITTVSPTPVTSNPGVQSTPASPVKPAPVLPTPTPVPPTPTPQPPTPTPTLDPSSSPSPVPTDGATVTSAGPDGTATPVPGEGAGSSSLGNSLSHEDGNSLFARLAHLNPLIWLIAVCYFISMLLLGVAGLLRRRRH